jgi:thiol-disulfide isomerase/thioredoxin
VRKLFVRSIGFAAAAALAVMPLAGCSESVKMGTPSYTSTDGTVTEYKLGNRAPAVKWFGIDDNQQSLSYANLSGAVVVMNFWYAGCPPCRVETPALVDLSKTFAGKAQFVGVDVRDSLDTARAFKRTFGVSYPTILDASTGDVVLAFTGVVTPSAVPTTIVIDRQGRVAGRILGNADKETLKSMISRVVAEPVAGN